MLPRWVMREKRNKGTCPQVYITDDGRLGLLFLPLFPLSSQGATVVMACRSQARAEEAKGEIEEELKACRGSPLFPHAEYGKLVIMLVDLSEIASVRNFCLEFRKRFHRLDALVCNAGLNVSSNGCGV